MEIKKVYLDGKEIEIFVDDDIETRGIDVFQDDLEDTKELNLRELNEQKLENTMVMEEVKENGWEISKNK